MVYMCVRHLPSSALNKHDGSYTLDIKEMWGWRPRSERKRFPEHQHLTPRAAPAAEVMEMRCHRVSCQCSESLTLILSRNWAGLGVEWGNSVVSQCKTSPRDYGLQCGQKSPNNGKK